MNISCPHCHRPLVYEWMSRSGTGWCMVCGYFEYYESYEAFLDTMHEGDAGV